MTGLRTRSHFAVLVLVLAHGSVARVAGAEPGSAPSASPGESSAPSPAESASDIGLRGVDAFQSGRFAEAEEDFRAALRLARVPPFLFWLAQSLERQGKWVEAEDTYREAVSMEIDDSAQEQFREAQRKSGVALLALSPRVPVVKLRVAAGARVSVDGAPVQDGTSNLRLDPGHHEFTAQYTDGSSEKRSLDLAEAAREELVLRPVEKAPLAPRAPAPPPGPSSLERAGWITGGVGVVSLLTGIVSMAVMVQQSDVVSAECDGTLCSQTGIDANSTGLALSALSSVTTVVGALAIGTGAVLLWQAPTGPFATQTSLGVAPNFAGAQLTVRGDF